jgi:hypothetical protein
MKVRTDGANLLMELLWRRKLTVLKSIWAIFFYSAIIFVILLLTRKTPEEAVLAELSFFLKVLEVVVTILIAFYVSVLLHELGHAGVGRLFGLKLDRFIVWPVEIRRRSRLHIRLMSTLTPDMVGGVVFDTSTIPLPDAAVAMRRAALAGPVVSLVGSGLFLWLCFDFAAGRPDMQWKFMIVAIINGIGAVENFFHGDGGLYLFLKKGGPVAENEIRIHNLVRWLEGPELPRNWPKEAIAAADEMLSTLTGNEDEQLVRAALFKYFLLVDTGDVDGGIQTISSTLDGLMDPSSNAQPGLIDLLFLIRALHFAYWRNDSDRASEFVSSLPAESPHRESAEYFLTLAQINLAAGDVSGARAMAIRARAEIVRIGEQSGIHRMFGEWLDIIEQRINDASSPAQSIVATPAD